MNQVKIPKELSIDMDGACSLSLECWRLNRIADLFKDSNEGVGIRHGTRRIAETLDKLGLKVIDFAGRTYDPGMVPEVVEVREDLALLNGIEVVDETITPTLIWCGHVVKPGQIIVRRSSATMQGNAEGIE